jgi:hypothetical protein
MAALAGPARSQASDDYVGAYTDGNVLFADCQVADSFACLSYIIGAVDQLLYVQYALGGNRIVCIPPNVPQGQVRDIVIKYLADKPEERHVRAASVVVAALSAAFPCAPA